MSDNKKPAKSKAQLQAKRRLAYILYVKNGFDQKIIAEITDISAVSISNWKKEDKKAGKDWDADRIEERQGFDNERKRIKKHINNILDEVEKRKTPKNVPNASEGDTINKLSLAAKNLMTELTFAHISKSFELLVQYVQSAYGQEKAIEMVELCHEYLMTKI